MEPPILTRGKRFHQRVQADWEATAQGDPKSEKTIRLLPRTGSKRERRGRMDIFVGEHDGMVAVVEIKSTDWDRVEHVQKLLGAHQRQVWKYIERFLEGEGLQVSAGIIYPSAPDEPGLRGRIEEYLNGYGLQVVWYDEP